MYCRVITTPISNMHYTLSFRKNCYIFYIIKIPLRSIISFRELIFSFLLLHCTLIISGQINTCLVLDGCNNYFEIPDNDLLDFNKTLSVECWVKPNCDNENRIILSKQWCQGEYGYYLSLNNGKLFWSFSNDGFCTNTNTYVSVSTEIFSSQFFHVAVVHTEEDIVLFINGKEIEAIFDRGNFSPIKNSSEPIRIGAYKNINETMSNFYSGLIDEIRIWNIELNETLIQQRMFSPLTGDENGLILYLDMEQTGQGQFLELQNRSSYGLSMNAISKGFTTYSPYAIHFEDYEEQNIELGEDINTCDNSVNLSVQNDNYKSVLWSTGSNGLSIEVNENGTYYVLVETEQCKYLSDSIVINFAVDIELNQEINVCEGDTIEISNHQIFEEGMFIDTINSESNGCDTIINYSISFSQIDTTLLAIESCPYSTVFFNGEQLEVPSSSTFYFNSINNCDSVVMLEVFSNLTLYDEIELMACPFTSVEYEGVQLPPNSTTEFYYESTDGCDSIVTVNVLPISVNNEFLGLDTIVCGETYTLSSPGDFTLWSNGVISPSLIVTSSGTYYGTFTDENGCTISDTINVQFEKNEYYIPNIFSPSVFGVNNCFKPLLSPSIEINNYNFMVFSRWGELVFETSNPSECWDGYFNNQLANQGVYIWLLEKNNDGCQNLEKLFGEITLVR